MNPTIQKFFPGSTSSEETALEYRHRRLALKSAEEGIVLLKNTGVLPLTVPCSVALYGSGAIRTIKGGTGSGDVNARHTVSIHQGLKNAGIQISNTAWLAEYEHLYDQSRIEWRDDLLSKSDEQNSIGFFRVYTANPFSIPCGPQITKAESSLAIYVISRIAGEGKDCLAEEGSYYLSAHEHNELNTICALYESVIVVLNTGNLIDLSFLDDYPNIHGLIHMMQPGMEAGTALANIIVGNVTPSGKLVDTWAYCYEDYPNSATFSHNNGNIQEEFYTDGIYVGYRYFDSFMIKSRYCFGFGLSYTQFSTHVLPVELHHKNGQSLFRISTLVTNCGLDYVGKEVIQVYLSCPQETNEHEHRRLCAFAKTPSLKPGESATVDITIPLEQLASFDPKESCWKIESGIYGFWVGSSLENARLVHRVAVETDVFIQKTAPICQLRKSITELTLPSEQRIARYRLWSQSNTPLTTLSGIAISRKNQNTVSADDSLLKLLPALSIDDKISLLVGQHSANQKSVLGSSGTAVPGSAGETSAISRAFGLEPISMADGPAGLRLQKFYHVHEDGIIPMPLTASLEGGYLFKNADLLPGTRYYQYCTAIPIGTVLAQTWNTELLQEIGHMVGEEMEQFHITLWLAPGMNIHRNPLCGRNFEYYSEDPFLSGKIASAIVKGVQTVPGRGATIKHLACNNQEDNRMGVDSIITERTLREIYLRGFEIAVKESQPWAIMTSYNLINGVHSANSYDLCTQAVRNEWGFDGIIMTDWCTTLQKDDCSAAGCVQAGNDLTMPGTECDTTSIRTAISDQLLSLEHLDSCTLRILRLLKKVSEQNKQ